MLGVHAYESGWGPYVKKEERDPIEEFFSSESPSAESQSNGIETSFFLV